MERKITRFSAPKIGDPPEILEAIKRAQREYAEERAKIPSEYDRAYAEKRPVGRPPKDFVPTPAPEVSSLESIEALEKIREAIEIVRADFSAIGDDVRSLLIAASEVRLRIDAAEKAFIARYADLGREAPRRAAETARFKVSTTDPDIPREVEGFDALAILLNLQVSSIRTKLAVGRGVFVVRRRGYLYTIARFRG